MTSHSDLAELSQKSLLVDGISDDALSLAAFLTRISPTVRVIADAKALRTNTSAVNRLNVRQIPLIERIDGRPIDLGGAEILYVDIFTSYRDDLIVNARASGVQLSSLADIVLRLAPAKSIGITGSAGKTTTTHLLTTILRSAGYRAVGSTDFRFTPSGPGKAMLQSIGNLERESWRVIELTSHHLDYVNVSPHIGVVTNFFPDHQDWHGSLGAYQAAKERLLSFQVPGDLAVLNFDDTTVRMEFAKATRGRTIHFSVSGAIDMGVVCSEGYIVIRTAMGQDRLCRICDMAMPPHHLSNALAASTVALELGIPAAKLSEILRNFKGVPQRSSSIGKVNGVDVLDDTLALSPRKALSGLETFQDQSLVVVCGGALSSPGGERRVSSDLEKADLLRFCKCLSHKAYGVVVFGRGGDEIARLLDDKGSKVLYGENFEEALVRALGIAKPGGQVLVSPVFFSPPSELSQVLDNLVRSKAEAFP